MHKSKTLRRLGLGAGVATVVGTMSMALMPAAFASAPTGATLALSNTNTGTPNVTATNTFVATTAIPAGGTVTINSTSTSVPAQSAADSVQLSVTAADYTVTCSPTCNTGVATSNTISAAALTANTATLTLTTGVSTGATVTVTIAKSAGGTGVTNPTSPSNVFFQDSTSTDTSADNTNQIAITTVVSSTPSVTDVNPHTTPAAGGQTMTVTGTNFFKNGTPSTNPTVAAQSPIVCFTPAGDTAGAAAAVAPGANSCPPATAPSSGAAPQGTAAFQAYPLAEASNPSTTQIQITAPVLPNAANYTWDVVVYNWNPAANGGAGAYIGPSATSSSDQVVSVNGLDFIPERGVRVADSRTGTGIAQGAIASGTTVAVPLGNFANSAALPDNLPGNYTALAMNVTAVAPTSPGNLEVSAVNAGVACPKVTTGSTSPAAAQPATVNFQPPQDTGNYTIVPIPSTAGSLCIGDAGASVNVVIDLTGYSLAGGYSSLLPDGNTGPERLADTRVGYDRNGTGLLGPLPGGTVETIQLFPAFAGPATVAFNVAVTNETAVGNLRMFPATGTAASETCPTSASGVPNTAVDNYIPGVDASSFVIMQIPIDGKMCLYSDSPGTVNVVIDGYGTVTSAHVKALAGPERAFDSRPGGIASGSSAKVTASPSGSGANFVPIGAVAVIGDISDILPTTFGNLQTAPDGAALPNTATINNYPNQIRENLAIVALNPSNGSFDIFSSGSFTNSTFDPTAYIQ